MQGARGGESLLISVHTPVPAVVAQGTWQQSLSPRITNMLLSGIRARGTGMVPQPNETR